jgi:hypothetical protein
MASTGSMTLMMVDQRAPFLEVACSRCDRAGRYVLTSLIARHGPDFGVPELLGVLSADCSKRKSLSAYDLCGIHCPQLPELFPSAPRPG